MTQFRPDQKKSNADVTPPSTFRFKCFSIEQSRSAMKVGFDGVLLGAWADVSGCRQILDVGTGTGLIALMLAQRTEHLAISEFAEPVSIEAVEIDPEAFREAASNFHKSPWNERIRCHHQSAQEFANTEPTQQFDLIVCNPPFFDSGGRSENDSELNVATKTKTSARTIARHADRLTIAEIFQLASVFSAHRICLILPLDRESDCTATAANAGMWCRRRTTVRHSPDKPAKRVLLEFQAGESATDESPTDAHGEGRAVTSDIAIETGVRHEYTAEFQALTSVFYLKM